MEAIDTCSLSPKVEKDSYDGDDELCDLEVQHLMSDYITKDWCICRKYRKQSSMTKQCPFCQDEETERDRNTDTDIIKDYNSARTYSPALLSSYISQYRSTNMRGVSLNKQKNKKRKPKVLPATEYIARYYLPQLMKYENLSIPLKCISLYRRLHLVKPNGSTRELTSSTTCHEGNTTAACPCIQNSEADDKCTLSVDLSRLFI